MPVVTLVLAAGPGFPQGSPEHRYEITVALTPQGQLDSAAWAEDTAPWPARRFRPDRPPREGDVQYDEGSGWFLRFFPEPGEAADAAPPALIRASTQLRPGEYVTVREPNGTEFSYRVVGVQ